MLIDAESIGSDSAPSPRFIPPGREPPTARGYAVAMIGNSREHHRGTHALHNLAPLTRPTLEGMRLPAYPRE